MLIIASSLFFGNLFVFIKFQGKTHIDVETRNVVFGALTAVCAVGIIFLILLRPARRAPNVEDAKVHSDTLIHKVITLINRDYSLVCYCLWALYTRFCQYGSDKYFNKPAEVHRMSKKLST